MTRYMRAALIGLGVCALLFPSGIMWIVTEASELLSWSWPNALLPFTGFGIVVWSYFIHEFLKALEDQRSPPPDLFESPAHWSDPRTKIFRANPELLAGICLGFQARGSGMIFQHSYNDSWGIYSSLGEEDSEAEFISLLTSEGSAITKKLMESDPKVFRNIKSVIGAQTDMLGSESEPIHRLSTLITIASVNTPGRDNKLKRLAPRVKDLLEQELGRKLHKTRLPDGTTYLVGDLNRTLSKRIQENRRQRGKIRNIKMKASELEVELEQSRTRLAEEKRRQKDIIEDAKKKERTSSRVQSKKITQGLEDNLRNLKKENGRLEEKLRREEKQRGKAEQKYKTLEQKYKTLEQSTRQTSPDSNNAESRSLQDVRILLVGGLPQKVSEYERKVEELGGELNHAADHRGVELVDSADLVIFATNHLEHSTFETIKNKCIARDTPYVLWSKSSSNALVDEIYKTLSQ